LIRLTPGAGYRSDGVVFMNSQDSFGVWQHQGADEAGQNAANEKMDQGALAR
jgi:hypothetical protein